ncbi:MAG: hypothetical protein Q7K40_00770 [bacterium]|nr:hypothetical protein [bacterium]
MKFNKIVFVAGSLVVLVVSIIVYYFFYPETGINREQKFVKDNLTKEDCLHENLIAVFENDKSDYVGKVKVIIRDKQYNKIISSFDIDDVAKRNYHPVEIHECGVYALKSFNYDYKSSKTLSGFSRELWFYDYSGNGKLLVVFSGESASGVPDAGGIPGRLYSFNYSYDFRVSPQETHVILLRGYLESSDYALIVKDLETLKDVFVLPIADIERENPDIIGDVGLKGWSRDGRYFWAGMAYGANTLSFIRIDIKTMSFAVFAAPKDVLGGDALNIEKGLITVHPGNVWYGIADVTEQEKAERRKQGAGTELYIENLFTKKREFVAKTDEPLYYFKPKWLSDTELQYELPNGERKIYKINI